MLKLNWRRMPVKIAGQMVFAIGGPGLCAERWGAEGIIWYIQILCISRYIASELTSRIADRSTRFSIIAHRTSPLFLTIGGLLLIYRPDSDFTLLLLPVVIGFYVAGYWTSYFDIQDIKGERTQDYQTTEVVSTVIAAVLVIGVSYYYTVELGVVLGGFIAILTCFFGVGVSPEELSDSLARWKIKARARNSNETQNGQWIVRSVAAINFCNISSLRLEIFTEPGSILAEIITLGSILAFAELILLFLAISVPYNNSKLRETGFLVTILGFCLMALGGPWLPMAGYILVSSVSRSINRPADREYARPALRGIQRPGHREVTRYQTMAILLPLIWIPSILPLVGIIAGVMLFRCDM